MDDLKVAPTCKMAGMKRALVLLVLVVLAGCSRAPKVGLVVGMAGLGDRGYSDLAHQGLLRAQKEFGIRIEVREPTSLADIAQQVEALSRNGCALVVALGFSHGPAVQEVSARWPGTKFAMVDSPIEARENVVSYVFRENEGSLLVGAIAGLVTKSGTVGFLGGMESPVIQRFERGYRQGVELVRPRAKVLVRYVGRDTSAFSDEARAYELSRAMYAAGADVAFHAASRAGFGLIRAAKEAGTFAIGVDANQNGVAPGTVLTSMLKHVDLATYHAAKSVVEGAFHPGIIVLGLSDRGVDYAVDDHNRSLLSPAVLARVEQIRSDYLAGLIPLR